MSKLYHTGDNQNSLLEAYRHDGGWVLTLRNANFTRSELFLSMPEFKAFLRCLDFEYGQVMTKEGYYIDVCNTGNDMIEIRMYHLIHLTALRGWFLPEDIGEFLEEINEDQ